MSTATAARPIRPIRPTRPADSGPNTPVRSTLRDRPWLIVAALLPAGIATVIGVDWMLGDVAEFFNGFGLLEAWGQVLDNGGVDAGHRFIVGQEAMGTPLALMVGSVALVVEPVLVLAALVFGARVLTRRPRRRV